MVHFSIDELLDSSNGFGITLLLPIPWLCYDGVNTYPNYWVLLFRSGLRGSHLQIHRLISRTYYPYYLHEWNRKISYYWKMFHDNDMILSHVICRTVIAVLMS